MTDVSEAMARAIELARRGPAHGPNPRVGCVLLGPDGSTLGEGFHAGAGTPHAEVAAITDARAKGADVAGATAVVTLEPCKHTGRTGPCVDALTDAGVARVVFAVADPGAEAGGGAAVLRERGIDAAQMETPEATELNRYFLHAQSVGRPFVIAKFAASLDGRIAAADGTSRWIAGEEARAHAHALRSEVDAILVGTTTVAVDDPELSARPGGEVTGHQPLRVAMGLRDTAGARIWRDGNAMWATTRDPAEALAALHARQVRSVIVEGGATIHAAFFRAGVVDEVHAYVAPMLLGDGPPAVGSMGIGTIAQALRLTDVRASSWGADTLIIGRPARGG